MKSIIKLAAVLAVVVSTGVQAHPYTAQIASWRIQLQANAAIIRKVGCNMADYEHMITCTPARAASLAAEVLEGIKVDASDADARERIKLAADVLDLTHSSNEIYQPMYAAMRAAKFSKLKEATLNAEINAQMRIVSEMYETSDKGAQ